MIVSLIILGALIAVGSILYLLDKKQSGIAADQLQAKDGDPGQSAVVSGPDAASDSEVCCGMHLTCEKDSLLADVSDRVEYFDDEELDRFSGRTADSYTPEETEEFRDVLMTLIPADIAPWARSIQLRGIILPPEIRDELLFLVAENRKN